MLNMEKRYRNKIIIIIIITKVCLLLPNAKYYMAHFYFILFLYNLSTSFMLFIQRYTIMSVFPKCFLVWKKHVSVLPDWFHRVLSV